MSTNKSRLHSSESESPDRTETQSWKEKRGATRWSRDGDEIGLRRSATIADRLSGGDRRTFGPAAAVLAAVCADPRLLGRVIDTLDHEDSVVRRRAADIIEKATRRHHEWLHPFTDTLLDRALAGSDRPDVQCHLIQLVPRLDPQSGALRKTTSALFRMLDNPSANVRASALQALHDLAASRPRLRARVRASLVDALENGSPAVKARARRLLSETAAAGHSRRRSM